MKKADIKSIITEAMQNALRHIPPGKEPDWRFACRSGFSEIAYSKEFREAWGISAGVEVKASFEKSNASVTLNWGAYGPLDVVAAVAAATQHLELAHKAARVQVILQRMIASLHKANPDDIDDVLRELYHEGEENARALAVLDKAYARGEELQTKSKFP